jgi:pimeloyl-ACP methyl ester carboxylesterase
MTTADGIVLVHGGHHDASCWASLVPLLDAPACCVDLPGRGARPCGERPFTLADFSRAVLADADAAGFGRVVLVGHSMGGLTISQVARDAPERIAHLVYVAALVPPAGTSTAALYGLDPGPPDDPGTVDPPSDRRARKMFGNDMGDEQWERARRSLVPEPVASFHLALDGVPTGIPTTYVQMARDVAVPPDLAARMVEQLGPDVTVHPLDAGHNVMQSQPEALAAIVNATLA